MVAWNQVCVCVCVCAKYFSGNTYTRDFSTLTELEKLWLEIYATLLTLLNLDLWRLHLEYNIMHVLISSSLWCNMAVYCRNQMPKIPELASGLAL